MTWPKVWYPIYNLRVSGQLQFKTPLAAKWLKSIPYLWPKWLKNHTLWRRTYLYSPYKGVPPPPPPPGWTPTLFFFCYFFFTKHTVVGIPILPSKFFLDHYRRHIVYGSAVDSLKPHFRCNTSLTHPIVKSSQQPTFTHCVQSIISGSVKNLQTIKKSGVK